MVQHADTFDQVHGPVERRVEVRQVEDIRLPEPDGVEAVPARLHGRVAQARPAEIERQQPGVRRVGERGLDCLPAGAAARDQDAQRAAGPAAVRLRPPGPAGNPVEKPPDGAGQRRLHPAPAWVGVGLVLSRHGIAGPVRGGDLRAEIRIGPRHLAPLVPDVAGEPGQGLRQPAAAPILHRTPAFRRQVQRRGEAVRRIGRVQPVDGLAFRFRDRPHPFVEPGLPGHRGEQGFVLPRIGFGRRFQRRMAARGEPGFEARFADRRRLQQGDQQGRFVGPAREGRRFSALGQQQAARPGERVGSHPVEPQRCGQAGGGDPRENRRRDRGQDIRQLAGRFRRARVEGEMGGQHLDRRHRMALRQQHPGEQYGGRAVLRRVVMRLAQQHQGVAPVALGERPPGLRDQPLRIGSGHLVLATLSSPPCPRRWRPQSLSARGSRASCRPSPRKLNAITVMKIIRPGQIISSGALDNCSWAPVSMLPQLGIGG